MDVTTLIVLGSTLIPLASSQYFPLFGFGAASRWCEVTHGGTCKTSCASGEYVLGRRPCAFGYLGVCCAKTLRCTRFGGVCRRSCDVVEETSYRYRVSCPRSQTCCLKTPRALSYILPGPSLDRSVPQQPVGGRITGQSVCGVRGRGLTGGRGGGTPASCEWPWMVSIKLGSKLNPGPFLCAGVLIADDKVLTTASCVLRRQVFVTVGDVDPTRFGESGEQSMDVRRTVISQNYNRVQAGRPVQRGDLAILTLSTRLNRRGCLQPVCLPGNNAALSETHRCVVAGWGINNTSTSPGRVLQSGVNVVGFRLCSLVMNIATRQSLPVDKLCSSPVTRASNTCTRDTGDMLVCEDRGRPGVWSLYGVLSDNACSQTLPVVYTNIINHLTWIRANI